MNICGIQKVRIWFETRAKDVGYGITGRALQKELRTNPKRGNSLQFPQAAALGSIVDTGMSKSHLLI
jgi:hypothetical protein